MFLFVSHVSEDRAAALEIVEELERRGVRCWIAPRDVAPGEPYDDEIARAIEECRAMLLIFSERCNDSEYIRREVTVAGESHKVVIPFRIENAQPKRGLRVRLSDLNWLDGFVSREKAIDELIRTFPQDKANVVSGLREHAEAKPARRPASRLALAGGFLLVLAVLGAGGFWLVRAPATSIPLQPPAPSAPLAPVAEPATKIDLTVLSPLRERELKPKDTFRECSLCPEMVVAPAGAFVMGSPPGEVGRTADEGPQHKVTFAQPFAVGRFELTFDEWDACVADGSCWGYKPDSDGWGRGQRPVINVSWDDATAYVAWLAKKTGKSYRLLSEAEREYIARAGTTTPFWWGSSISTDQANYNGDPFGKGAKGEYRGRTVPVDSFAPNPWGLYQVHGNIYEWTQDCWVEGYKGAPVDGSAWTRGDCGFHTIRGGSWDYDPSTLRSAGRLGYNNNTRAGWLGFRVARTLLAP